MIDIDLKQYKDLLKINKKEGTTYIFDPIRQKEIILLPEELVRQLLIQYLLTDRLYSPKLIKVEKGVDVNGQTKRFDIVIYDNMAKPKILVECKRPEEKIKQSVFNQISTYNLALQADFMVVTNGMETYCCKMNYELKTYDFLDSIPTREALDNNTESKSMANKLGSWNLNEFLTFLLIHASYADFDFTEEEEKIVKSLLSEEDYKEISAAYDTMGDYRIEETILSYKGLHYPTVPQKQEMLGRMMQLFNADGDYSTMEKKLYAYFDKLL